MERKFNMSDVWGVLQKVAVVVETMQSPEFATNVETVKTEAGQVVSEAKDTVQATATLVKQFLDIFQISPENFSMAVDADTGRGMLTPFEQEVFHLLQNEDIPF
jgi:hypothetical protein